MKTEYKDAQIYMQASLVLFGDQLDPNSVTKALRIAPDKSWKKGEEFQSHGHLIVRKTGLWSIRLRRHTDDLRGLIDELFTQLPLESDLREIIDGIDHVRLAVFVSSYLNETNATSVSLNLSSKQIEILSRSGGEIMLDVAADPEE